MQRGRAGDILLWNYLIKENTKDAFFEHLLKTVELVELNTFVAEIQSKLVEIDVIYFLVYT